MKSMQIRNFLLWFMQGLSHKSLKVRAASGDITPHCFSLFKHFLGTNSWKMLGFEMDVLLYISGTSLSSHSGFWRHQGGVSLWNPAEMCWGCHFMPPANSLITTPTWLSQPLAMTNRWQAIPLSLLSLLPSFFSSFSATPAWSACAFSDIHLPSGRSSCQRLWNYIHAA